MKELLKLIKPKTVSNEKYAWLDTSSVLLDFGLTKVLGQAQTGMPSCVIPMKELFAENFDAATQLLGEGPVLIFPDTEDDAWIRVPINVMDASVFNSVASAGESDFWAGRLIVSSTGIQVDVAGCLYYLQYKMAKVLPNVLQPIILDLTWDAFYYLYKMFSGVAIKKPDELLLSTFDPMYMRGVNTDIRMKVVQDAKLIDLNQDRVNAFIAYGAEDYANSRTQSKKFLTDTSETLFKHLGKPFKDNIETSESTRVVKMTDGMYYTLYMNKRKP